MNKNEMKSFVELGELLSYVMLSHEAVILASEQGVFISKDMAVFRLKMMELLAKYAEFEYRTMSADDSLTQNDD